MNNILLQTGNDEWETPDYVFNYYNKIYDYTLDACATINNKKVNNFIPYINKLNNSLTKKWEGVVWCNPPYSKGNQSKFIDKALKSIEDNDCQHVTLLIPARTDTNNFRKLVTNKYVIIYLIIGRINFKGGKNGSTFGSMIVHINKDNESIMNKIKVIERKEIEQ